MNFHLLSWPLCGSQPRNSKFSIFRVAIDHFNYEPGLTSDDSQCTVNTETIGTMKCSQLKISTMRNRLQLQISAELRIEVRDLWHFVFQQLSVYTKQSTIIRKFGYFEMLLQLIRSHLIEIDSAEINAQKSLFIVELRRCLIV